MSFSVVAALKLRMVNAELLSDESGQYLKEIHLDEVGKDACMYTYELKKLNTQTLYLVVKFCAGKQ